MLAELRQYFSSSRLVEPKNSTPTVKYEGGSIMIWSSFLADNAGASHIIRGDNNGATYQEILKENFIKTREENGHSNKTRSLTVKGEGARMASQPSKFNPTED